jgi:copper homeostasis protein (lipoprotein)
MRNVLPLIFLSILFFIYGCSNPTKSVQTNDEGNGKNVVPDMHTSQIALDYYGTYTGILPCADCEGIETTIVLSADGKYQIKIVYRGKSNLVFEKSGAFSWNDVGNTITLEGIENAPKQYFVGENMLIQLDMEGNRIIGELAEKYILGKTE